MVDELSFGLRPRGLVDHADAADPTSTDGASVHGLDTTDGASVPGLDKALDFAVDRLQDGVRSRLAADTIPLRIGGVRGIVDTGGGLSGLSSSCEDVGYVQRSRDAVPHGLHVSMRGSPADAVMRGEALSRGGRGSSGDGLKRTEEEKCFRGAGHDQQQKSAKLDSEAVLLEGIA
jgi:hypothetical protein